MPKDDKCENNDTKDVIKDEDGANKVAHFDDPTNQKSEPTKEATEFKLTSFIPSDDITQATLLLHIIFILASFLNMKFSGEGWCK